MPSSTNNPPLTQTQVLPNGPSLLALVHENLVQNFSKDLPANVQLPTLWRLAAHVTGEISPIVVYSFQQDPT
jgi:hypothetical protein